MAADTSDLLTIAEARAVLSIGDSDTTKEATLEQYITGCSAMLANRVGPIIYGTITGELHDGGQPFVFLSKKPVQGVTQVVEYDGTTAATLTAQTNTSQTVNQYLYAGGSLSGQIIRRETNSDARFATGRNNVLISYVVGRFASTATVDARYKNAAGLILRNAWRIFENSVLTGTEFETPFASFPKFAMPNAVKDILGADWDSGSGFAG